MNSMKRRKQYIAIIRIALIVALFIAIGMFVSIAANLVNRAFIPFVLSFLIIQVLMIGGVTFWSYFVKERERPNLGFNPRNRTTILMRLQQTYLNILEHTMHNRSLIVLELKERQDAGANPWRFLLQEQDQVQRQFPPGTSIIQVFDDANGELLILGEPGSGKTTLLLELARVLLDRALEDENYLMPVVFNLSSWAVKRQPITNWLAEGLANIYLIPRTIGQTLIERDMILPLLDGLDEVVPEARTSCVNAINVFRQERGLVEIVVCSRTADYFSQPSRLILHSAVEVLPLTEKQIDIYLSQLDNQFAGIRKAWRNDIVLHELVSTPRALSFLIQSPQLETISDNRDDSAVSLEARQLNIIKSYLQRALARQGIDPLF